MSSVASLHVPFGSPSTAGHAARRAPRTVALALGLGAVLGLAACGSGEDAAPPAQEAMEPAAPVTSDAPIVSLLANGQAVFGMFSGPQTREQGMVIAHEERADFILFSMESGPFDVPNMVSFLDGMREAGGPEILDQLPVVLRVPPIHEDVEAGREKVAAAMATGIAGIVYPHVVDAAEAALSVEFMTDMWPADPAGSAVNILIIEDQVGISNAREIMATPGLSVVFAGPGDLRRAYDGDMVAVEAAIQTVLAACLEFDVACGVTAGVDDIGTRLEEGFRMIIVTEPAALAVGLAAAGR